MTHSREVKAAMCLAYAYIEVLCINGAFAKLQATDKAARKADSDRTAEIKTWVTSEERGLDPGHCTILELGYNGAQTLNTDLGRLCMRSKGIPSNGDVKGEGDQVRGDNWRDVVLLVVDSTDDC